MLVLYKHDGNEFAPPCLAPLMSPRLISYHEERELPHPITAFNASWWKLRSQFDVLLTLIDGYAVGAANDRNKPIMDAIETLHMRVANFVDVLEIIIPGALLPNPKGRFELPRTLRKELMMPANKLKHEANDITLCGAKWWAVSVTAYMIFHMRDRSKIANPLFHHRRDAFSFNVELRRLIVKIYKFAAAVGEQIQRLGYGVGAASGTHDENAALIHRIVGMSHYCWWDETDLMPKVEFDGEVLRLSDKGGRASAINRYQATFTALGTMDGYSRNIGLRGRTD